MQISLLSLKNNEIDVFSGNKLSDLKHVDYVVFLHVNLISLQVFFWQYQSQYSCVWDALCTFELQDFIDPKLKLVLVMEVLSDVAKCSYLHTWVSSKGRLLKCLRVHNLIDFYWYKTSAALMAPVCWSGIECILVQYAARLRNVADNDWTHTYCRCLGTGSLWYQPNIMT